MDALRKLGIEITHDEHLSLPPTVRLATPEDGPVPLPEFQDRKQLRDAGATMAPREHG